MTDRKIYTVSNPYDFFLKEIKSVRFTKREIDVIACLPSGRSLKGISNFLGIHYKTLEVHMANIRQKLGFSVRDHIIEALENLPESQPLKCRYQQLQHLKLFQEILQKAGIDPSIKEKGITIFYTPKAKKLAQCLQKQLSTLACPVKACLWNPEKFLNDIPASIFLTTPEEKPLLSNGKDGIALSVISSPTAENTFYYQVLNVLEPFIIFKDTSSIQSLLPTAFPTERTFYKKPTWLFKLLKQWIWVIIFLIGGYIFYKNFSPESPPSHFLERPSLQRAIDQKLSDTSSTTNPLVILVGNGGIGKTTTARIFLSAHSQHFCWELNGETRTTLINSYMALATHLAQRFNLKTKLEDVLSIQETSLREAQMLVFIQDCLKKTSWILLYDNVENWPEITPYLPLNPHKWGQGKILLTTRNQVVSSFSNHIMEVPMLTEKEALSLFLKFYDKGNKKEETLTFLKRIPPFPLDISLAASYLTAIDLSYEDYLKRLQTSSDDFNRLQASLHYQGGYQTTRHQIIVQAIDSITRSNTFYKELCLLCCLLDAEDIPYEILEHHTPKADAFIYQMKKHSLLKSLKEGFFSIHRSTQHHGLIYFINHLTSSALDATLLKLMSTLETIHQQNIQKDKSYNLTLLRHLESFREKLRDLPIPETSKIRLFIRVDVLRASVYDKALSNVQKVKEILLQILASDTIIKSLSVDQKREVFVGLGHVYGLSGNFQEAIQYYKKGLTLSKTLRNPEYVVKSLISIGFEYVWLSKFEQANHYLQEGLKEAQKLPEMSPDKKQLIADAYTFLATLYSTTFLEQQEGNSKALSYLEKAQKIIQTLPNHERSLLRVYRNKAQVYCRGKQYEESLEKCIKPAREILKNLSGPAHNLLRLSLDACEGEILLRQEKIISARDLLEKTVTKYQTLLGNEDAFMILYPLVHYIEALVKNKEFKKAQEYIQVATHMKNPAYTNFHKSLYKQLDYYKNLTILQQKKSL
jgi:tetratricopeptide (TPR) repeat protein/DNA-binding CsgD family transcriptional regulator